MHKKNLDGKTIDKDDQNVFKVGAAKSLCNMIEILDPDHSDEDPNDKSKEYIAKLMVAAPSFDDDMKAYIKGLAEESPFLMDVVGGFNWLDTAIAPDAKIIGEIVVGLSANVKEILSGIPFAGAALKLLLTQAKKLVGHFLRPMAHLDEWKDNGATLKSFDLNMKRCDWNPEDESSYERDNDYQDDVDYGDDLSRDVEYLSRQVEELKRKMKVAEEKSAIVVARRRRVTTNRRNRSTTEEHLWT